ISYAVWWIRQSILQEIGANRTIRAPTNRLGLLRKIREVQAGTVPGGRRKTEKEIAHAVGASVGMVRETLENARRLASLDDSGAGLSTTGSAGSEGDDGQTLLDSLPDESSEPPDELLNRQDQRQQIQTVLQRLPEREAEVVRRYFGLDGEEPITLEEIGSRLRLTRERVRQLKERALQRLRSPANMELLAALLGDNEPALRRAAAERAAVYTAAHRKKPYAPEGSGSSGVCKRRRHRRTSVLTMGFAQT
ncbi:MAG: sigma-70 family RNA polymerase sigma factor, partial [Patescibacteria group bacterium]